MKLYYPYPSDKPKKKFFIITNEGERIYFGAAGYEDYTTHKDEKRKLRYINRHKKNESKFWNNPNNASYWALKLLWNKTTIKDSYEEIKKELKLRGYI